jgi:hypothetical protein
VQTHPVPASDPVMIKLSRSVVLILLSFSLQIHIHCLRQSSTLSHEKENLFFIFQLGNLLDAATEQSRTGSC